jgi:hypothetical protein
MMIGDKVTVIAPDEHSGVVVDGEVIRIGARSFRVSTKFGNVTFSRNGLHSGCAYGYGRFWRFVCCL